MSLFLFLSVLQAIIAAALVGVILMQRSEGGGLGIGGSPSGMMSARGAADFLTRTTRILAILFVLMSIALAVIAASQGSDAAIESTLQRGAPAAVAPAQPAPADPVGGAVGDASAPAGPPAAAPAAPAATPAPAQ
ncbi:MAG: preprotein translocase subunit SecG [Pelagerythrobacter marensis]|nr:MAG: preprotein translocase subunit SecG [Pelagerythrobacter marensis]